MINYQNLKKTLEKYLKNHYLLLEVIFLYTCPICHNKDPKYIGYKNNAPYCRKCISLIRAKRVQDISIKRQSLVLVFSSFQWRKHIKKEL